MTQRDKDLDQQNFCRISDNVELGEGVRILSFVNLYGCAIGNESMVGAFVEIQRGAKVGKRCKISSHSFICEGVTIEDECFIGHGVLFINDRRPSATNEDGSVQNSDDWQCEQTLVQRRASIGSGAIIMCGVTIGAGALIGAGAVVTRDVEPDEVVAGIPARVLSRA